MKKNAFTLAEVIIVLIAIGVIASFTVTSLIKGTLQSQWKSAYKKAFSTITNIASLEKATGYNMGKTTTNENVKHFFEIIENNLTTAGFIDKYGPGGNFIKDTYYAQGEIIYIYKWTAAVTGYESPWILGEDKIAYKVFNGTDCLTKSQINEKKDHYSALAASCVTVGVDTNGLLTGPNSVDYQVTKTEGIDKDTRLEPFTGERFYIYVGSDGTTTGNTETSVMSRIFNDIK